MRSWVEHPIEKMKAEFSVICLKRADYPNSFFDLCRIFTWDEFLVNFHAVLQYCIHMLALTFLLIYLRLPFIPGMLNKIWMSWLQRFFSPAIIILRHKIQIPLKCLFYRVWLRNCLIDGFLGHVTFLWGMYISLVIAFFNKSYLPCVCLCQEWSCSEAGKVLKQYDVPDWPLLATYLISEASLVNSSRWNNYISALPRQPYSLLYW